MYKLLEGLGFLFCSILAALYGINIIAANITFDRLCGTLASGGIPPAADIPPVPAAPPPLWLGIVFVIGAIVFLVLAVRSIIAGAKQWKVDVATSLHGVQLIGIVAESKSVRGSSEGGLFQVADIGVLQADNSILHFHTPLRIGEQYDIGDFLYVKQYKDDINVVRLVEPTDIPAETSRILKYYPKFWNLGYVGDYFINGHVIAGMTTIKINDKRYNAQFDYDKAVESGVYEGDSGMYYKEDSKVE